MKDKKSLLTDIAPDVAAEFHPTLNENVILEQLSAHSGKSVWWICRKGHEWKARVSSRVYGAGCPFCSGLRATQETSLATMHPNIAREWHPVRNTTATPSDITSQSNKKVWWTCKEGHEWRAAVNSRVRGSKCPCCNNRKVIKGHNVLATTYPRLATEWHPTKNNGLTPYNVTTGSNKKVWWVCANCKHEWLATPGNRMKGSGCPVCATNKRKINR